MRYKIAESEKVYETNMTSTTEYVAENNSLVLIPNTSLRTIPSKSEYEINMQTRPIARTFFFCRTLNTLKFCVFSWHPFRPWCFTLFAHTFRFRTFSHWETHTISNSCDSRERDDKYIQTKDVRSVPRSLLVHTKLNIATQCGEHRRNHEHILHVTLPYATSLPPAGLIY